MMMRTVTEEITKFARKQKIRLRKHINLSRRSSIKQLLFDKTFQYKNSHEKNNIINLIVIDLLHLNFFL